MYKCVCVCVRTFMVCGVCLLCVLMEHTHTHARVCMFACALMPMGQAQKERVALGPDVQFCELSSAKLKPVNNRVGQDFIR